ncbi:MAG: 50S ribosomal protein L11 methyltransferase [Pseudomonadota bacterium]|nr:50S ribosomal protein L11 methyltransferase [Pseudomonadota bacterium]
MTHTILWEIALELPHSKYIEIFEAAFERLSVATATFQIETTPKWRFTVYIPDEVTKAALEKKLQSIESHAGVSLPVKTIRTITERDWVAEYQKGMRPIKVGSYYISGSHVSDPTPLGCVSVKIDAGLAFGTGGHETTRSCLEAMEEICGERPPVNALDLGTGSGILAIALAKRHKVLVFAGDQDHVAIRVARENAVVNGVGKYIKFFKSDGFQNPELRRNAPFELIIANIFSKPLIGLAEDIANATGTNGKVVLSGILTPQVEAVTDTFRDRGLVLIKKIIKADWETVVLERVT